MLLVQLFLAIELVNTGSAFMRVCEVFGFQPVKMKSDTNLQALRSIQLQLPRTAEKIGSRKLQLANVSKYQKRTYANPNSSL